MNYEAIKLPPHNIEAEQSILGGLLVDNNAIDRLGDLLPEAAFYRLEHRMIFRAIQKLAAQGKSCDVITVASMLESFEKLEQCGGLAYLGSLASEVPSSANIRAYANIVAERFTRRRILQAGMEMMELAHDAGGDVLVAMDKAQTSLISITQSVEADEPQSIETLLTGHIQRIEHRGEGGNKAITTGLRDLDDKLNGGWHRGQVIVQAGRPSMGKTGLAMHHGTHAAMAGFGVMYLSMEMVSEELCDRSLASIGSISLSNILTGRLESDEWSRMSYAQEKLNNIQLHIVDRSGLNFYQVATFARRHKRKHGLDLLVLDYLQLMAGTNSEDKRHSQIEEITRGLKALAKELDCAIILLSQLSRKTEQTRRPKLSDLRDSGSIEQDADVVIFIHREEVDNPETTWRNYADLYIAKQRQGPLARIGVQYHGEFVRFDEFTGACPDWSSQSNNNGRTNRGMD